MFGVGRLGVEWGSPSPSVPLSLARSAVLSSRCLSPLPFHLLCDAVPCCVGTGVRDRVIASDRASPRALLGLVFPSPGYIPLPPFCASPFIPRTTGVPVFPGERASRSCVGGEDRVPLYPEALSRSPTYTFGAHLQQGYTLSRPVVRPRPTCRGTFFPRRIILSPKAASRRRENRRHLRGIAPTSYAR